jgi:YD repeat-containing protein
MEDTTGVTTSTFDPLDRRQSVVTPAGKAVTYAYDEVGLRASMMGN